MFSQTYFVTDNLVSWYALAEKTLPQRNCYRDSVYTEPVFAIFYTRTVRTQGLFLKMKPLHRETGFYTETCDTKKLLLVHRDSVHAGPAFTQGNFYTEKLVRRELFAQKIYTQSITEQLSQFLVPKPDLGCFCSMCMTACVDKCMNMYVCICMYAHVFVGKFGSAGAPRVACLTSVPERLEL